MKKEILLVEYDSRTIQILKDLFVDPIFELSIAADGEVAKKMLNNKTYDIVITAAMLPKFHGFNLSKYISQNYPGTKIIVISGVYRGISFKKQATIQYGADDFFEKPFDDKKFKKRIMDLLGINESDLTEKQEANATTTSVPLPDTTKVPSMEYLEKEKEKLTSQDLFGDIIEDVEKVKPLKININEDEESESKEIEKKLKEIDEVAKNDPSKTNFIPRKEIFKQKDLNLDELVKKEEDDSKQEKRYKEIDDEISKKLEETLSGLGIKKKDSVSEKPKSVKHESVSEKKAEQKDKKDKNQFGEYQLLGLIARGGMAEIYKAKKKGVKGFEKVIAIKKILSGYGEDNNYIEMFVDEAKIAAELSHPNIVQIYDFGRKDDYYFIAMEYVMGKDLRLILRKLKERDEKLPVELSVYIIIKTLEALDYAHSAKDSKGKELKIVHRDVSPPNILVSYNGDIKLTDFGVSKATIKEHQTISGALKGKLLYMSPEQAKGEKDIDFRSDIYSAGIILFELVTGEKLFLDSTEMGVLKKVQEGEVIKPSDISKDIDKDLEKIILKALENDKNKRYQDAGEMIKDLEEYLIKNFDHLPTSLHLAHFMAKVFREDSLKEGVKIDLKPLPFKIKRKEKKETKTEKKEEVLEKPVPELDELPEQLESEEIKGTTEVISDENFSDKFNSMNLNSLNEKDDEFKEINLKEIESKSLGEEKKEDIVSISFDEEQSHEPKGIPEEREEISHKIDTSIKREKKHKVEDFKTFNNRKYYSKRKKKQKKSKKGFFISLISIILIGVIVYFVLLNNLKEDINYDYSVKKSEVKKDTSYTGNDSLANNAVNAVEDQNKQTQEQLQTDNSGNSQTDTQGSTQLQSKTSQNNVALQSNGSSVQESNKTNQQLNKPIQNQNINKNPRKNNNQRKNTRPKPQKRQQRVISNQNTQKKNKTTTQSNIQKTPVKTNEIQTATTQNTQTNEVQTTKENEQNKTQTTENQNTQESQVEQTTTQINKQEVKKKLEPVKPVIKEGDIIAAAILDTPPVALSTPTPKVSPSLLRRLGGVQSVMVSYLVNHNGSVEKIRLLKKSKSKTIDKAVLNAVKKWKFKPGMKNGVRVKVWKTKMIILR